MRARYKEVRDLSVQSAIIEATDEESSKFTRISKSTEKSNGNNSCLKLKWECKSSDKKQRDSKDPKEIPLKTEISPIKEGN